MALAATSVKVPTISCLNHGSLTSTSRSTIHNKRAVHVSSRAFLCGAKISDVKPVRVSSANRQRRHCQIRSEKTLDELDAEFGIEDSLKIVNGKGGMKRVVLSHYNGSSAEVYLYGACVTSWTQPHGSEVLFMRPDAVFDGEKPISGGIPLCFPQFGPGVMQQHGFARNSMWDIISTSADVNPDYPEPAVTLKLSDNEYTRSMWDHSFEALYEVTLRRGGLQTQLRVQNTGSDTLDFTAALHSYIGVLDSASPSVVVKGMKGKEYLDKVPDPNNPERKVEDRESVTFGHGLVDSVYLDTDPEALLDVGTGCMVAIENTTGFTDHVVWNPHETMPACWQDFVCVESAKVGSPVILGPGEEWIGELSLSTFDL
ncbi:hypothetical protein CYMTET_47952 [Cymbomonas tetramitiformis]|uniref:glucose-6-phosphate 1-epimerase n=1 Tax=Cymbomonas tetramitiformis TaxID=36881 RepID=A0AAE0EVG1_9CHLO|nr:hypothetical protein CYMTET_47952 [Cymbomonas tetramitiformis]